MDSIMCVYEHTLAFISHHCHRFIDRMMKENSPPKIHVFFFTITLHLSSCFPMCSPKTRLLDR